MPDIQQLYPGDAKAALRCAHQLFARAGTTLTAGQVGEHLAQLAATGRELAVHIGHHLGPLCGRCAAKSHGGCCSRAFADDNDAVLLLMNLLAGLTVEVSRDNGHDDCLFLGPTGCTLVFKPIFCINYDCPAISRDCPPEALAHYQALRGRLLQEQWRVEQDLLDRLRELGELST